MAHTYPKSLLAVGIGVAIAALSANPAPAQQYGPRIFWPAPAGVNAVTLQILNTNANTTFNTDIVYPKLAIDSDAFVFGYTRNFELGNTSGQVTVSLPYALADIDAKAGQFELNPSVSGLADAYLHLRVGILGSPAVDLQEYGTYLATQNPDVVMHGLVAVTSIPIGQYDADRVVNIGSNRWGFRAALPTVINLGPNWAPGNRTTLELVPTVDLFTSNGSPAGQGLPGAAEFTAQDPLFKLEGHLTTDLGPKYFASLDAYYVTGGATSSNGVGNNNPMAWLGLGATLGGYLWPGGTLELIYGGVVAGNDNSPNGEQVRLWLLQVF
ncbi:MAG: transporter [Nodosilinea sp.]